MMKATVKKLEAVITVLLAALAALLVGGIARLGSTISLETLSAASRSFSFSTVAIEPL